MEKTIDFLTMSLMETLKYMCIKIKSYHKPTQIIKMASLSPEKQMDEVLAFYSHVIEHLWKIADYITKSTEAEEERVGTMYMGSSMEGTYLPEISEGFDAYVMDTQVEMLTSVEVIDSDSVDQMADSKHLLKLLCTERAGYYLITWTDFGLQVKAYHEAKRRACAEEEKNKYETRALGTILETYEIMFYYLQTLTEEIEVNGEIMQVLSPSIYRKIVLKKPPITIQGLPVWFRLKDLNSPAFTMLFEELLRNGKIRKIQVVDVVTCIRTTKPTLDRKWVEEKQSSSKWLTKDVLAKIQENKTFVVAKSWEKDQENDTCWRISFSVVERKCIKFLPPEPKICFIILKAIRRKFLNEPKGLVTYHLKTVLFYHLDKAGIDWEIAERAQNILILLSDLAEALGRRSLPLFFEPGINTLGGMDEKSILELEKKARWILASPGTVMMKGILFQSMDEAHKQENFQKGDESLDVWFDEKPSEPKLFDDDEDMLD